MLKQQLKNPYIQTTILGIAITALSILIATLIGAQIDYSGIDLIEIIAVATSYTCTLLVVKQKRFNYILGIISVALYCYIFYQVGLLASMVVQIYLIPTLIYGWFRWRKDTNTRPVTNIQTKWIPAYLAITITFWWGATQIITLMGGETSGWDSAILALTILAQFLLDNKKLQTWAVWSTLNIIAIILYFNTGLVLAAIQYVFFLGNAIYGHYTWNKSKQQTEETQQ